VARNQIEVAAPPSVVFAVLADPARYPDWVVGAKEISSFDHDWPAPGASFRHRFGLGPAAVSDVTTVLAADPPAELVLVACFGPVGAAQVRLRVDRSGAGSLVTMEERSVSGPLGAVRGARLLDLAIHLRNAESLCRLRRLAQGAGGILDGTGLRNQPAKTCPARRRQDPLPPVRTAAAGAGR
jgi:uncharacterized protein YndB with AHSA1/START domain